MLRSLLVMLRLLPVQFLLLVVIGFGAAKLCQRKLVFIDPSAQTLPVALAPIPVPPGASQAAKAGQQHHQTQHRQNHGHGPCQCRMLHGSSPPFPVIDV